MIVPEGASVYEPGQKAIIAWDGEREVLILSTDVWASENTWALELLPLPSRPARPEAGSFDSFIEVEYMVMEYLSDVYTHRGLAAPGKGLEVIFHENIGAHEILVVESSDAQALINLAENLLEGKGLTQEVSWERLRNLAEIYILQRGMSYWVLDLIDLSEYLMSREPIIYTFETDYLYFPLEISSLVSGTTDITLFTLTNDKLDVSAVENAGFFIASFAAGGEDVPIEFEVDENELNRISPEVAELFDGPAWLTTLTYEGLLENLKGDLMLDHVGAAVDNLLAIAWGIGIVLVLLGIFAVVYKISPYYKTSPSVTEVE